MDEFDAINRGIASKCAAGVGRIVDGVPESSDEQRATILRLTAVALEEAAAELDGES